MTGEIPQPPSGTGSLKDRLDAYSADLLRDEPDYARAYEALVTLLGSVFEDVAPRAGDTMPPFLLIDERGRMTALDDIIVTGPAVISFNRGHWCDYCDIELGFYAEQSSFFESCGTRILSITPEKQLYNRRLADRLRNKITVLTDIDNGYALSLGLVMTVGSEIHALLVESGIHLDVYQGNETWLLPIPATFVVDAHGRVVDRFVTVDFRKRLEVAQALAAVRSLQAR